MQTAHWPVVSYIPLLAFVPQTLQRQRKWLIVTTWSIAAVVMPVALFSLSLDRGPAALRAPFSGWTAINEKVEAILTEWKGPAPLLVADNYKLGANMEIVFGDRYPIYIMPHSKNYEHGRVRQFDRWGIGNESMRSRAGREALIVVQISEAPRGTEERWMKHLRWHFDPMVEIDELTIALGGHPRHDSIFVLYRGTVIPKP
jgi:hypothetical protein